MAVRSLADSDIRVAPVSARDVLTIARILRVNHAGEYGAIRIYTAQIAIARRLWPDQLYFLAGKDVELHGTIAAIREEELSHLHHAEEQIAGVASQRHVLRGLISAVTDTLIWLSSLGDSARMARDLRASR